MAYRLKTLTPIHIHSGEVLRPMEYIAKDEEVLIFDETDVIRSIKESELLNSELLNSYAFSSKRSEYYKNLDYYINKGIIDKSILNKYKVKAINKSANLNGKEIYRTMRNMQGTYIPGSSIKGVIRTAILYDYVLKKGIDYLKKAIGFAQGNRKFSVDDYIIYFTNAEKNIKDGKFKRNIQGDPFKFLIVRDVNMVENEVVIYDETIYDVSKFITGNILETIKEGDYTESFTFEILADEKNTKALKNREDYNIDLINYFNEKEILRVLYQFSNDVIEDEIEYFKQQNNKLFNSKEVVKKLEEIKEKNSMDSPVIRIGKGKGYKSNTIGLAIKKLDKDYYNREIKNIAKPYQYRERFEFPKTRNFVDSSISPKLLGFTLLEKVD